MGNRRKYKSKSAASSWVALAIAIILHATFLFIPLSKETPVTEFGPAQIELQLTTYSPPPVVPEIDDQQVEARSPGPIIESESIAKTKPAVVQATPSPETTLQPRKSGTGFSLEKKKPLPVSSILAAPFITEESEADKIFGRPIGQYAAEYRREFHYPVRQDLISMLDEPLPELPFAYTPGLVHFAYEPGLKGDLQRFWDVITPEFGWRTDNGTEFRCVWVLVVMGCGWK
jgi:hypothetical protein